MSIMIIVSNQIFRLTTLQDSLKIIRHEHFVLTAHSSLFHCNSGRGQTVIGWTRRIRYFGFGEWFLWHPSADKPAVVLILHHYNNLQIWIGLNDLDTEGTFVWEDNTPLGFTSWKPGDPNNMWNLEHCVEVNYEQRGYWNDIGCGDLKTFACKL